jgi:hemerythrin
VKAMDQNHEEFLDLLTQIQSSSTEAFLPLFSQMIEHTKEHFSDEEALMDQLDFYGKQEHIDEHVNLLGEMQYFYEKSKKLLPFGKSYINDYAFDKFKRHVINIDSQLAMFLKEQGVV